MLSETVAPPAATAAACHGAASDAIDGAPVVLVGNPNVGKSALFGALTGRYVEVSNFPGTTVEVTTGHVDGLPLIDTPGIQALMARSDDERVTRDILLARPPRLIVQVADARNLRRALLLTLQLAELGQPFVLDLNMTDEARARGLIIDRRRLSQILGAEVVETVAVRKEGWPARGRPSPPPSPLVIASTMTAPSSAAWSRSAGCCPPIRPASAPSR